MIHQNNPNLSKINIINHGCAHFTISTFFHTFLSTFLQKHYLGYETTSTTTLSIIFRYTHIIFYCVWTIVKRQRKQLGVCELNEYEMTFQKRALEISYETTEMQMKASYYKSTIKFIAVVPKLCFYFGTILEPWTIS